MRQEETLSKDIMTGEGDKLSGTRSSTLKRRRTVVRCQGAERDPDKTDPAARRESHVQGNASLQKEPPQQAALDEESNENLQEAQGEAKEEQGDMASMNFEVTDIQANRSCRRL